MEKGMCYAALGVAAIMLLVFLMDLLTGSPFGGDPFAVVDVFGIIASALVGYLGFNALKDVK